MNETTELIRYYPCQDLLSFTRDVFIKVGVPLDDAKICADVLLAADKRGIESHGLSRLKTYVDRIRSGQQNPITNLTLIKETPSTAMVDGNHGMGPVIAKKAMAIAIEKAKLVGTGSVAVRNSTHFGIAGYYPLMAIKENMIGICVTNTRPSMAPTFGVQPMLGTNPIAFGAPTDEDIPFLFDAATTIIQRGKVEIHARKDHKLKSGYVIDQDGNSATDPHEILTGIINDQQSLLPLGGAGEEFCGYKGYGLATIVEILSASLQNGNYLTMLTGFSNTGEKQPYGIGHFFQAMAIDAFISEAEFKKSTGDILRTLRNSRRSLGQKRIFTAGEKEFEAEKRSLVHGIAITSNLVAELNKLSIELHLNGYHF
jgi:LDH2 family malate/lactate/ureidoglycolate dehydrogenase